MGEQVPSHPNRCSQLVMNVGWLFMRPAGSPALRFRVLVFADGPKKLNLLHFRLFVYVLTCRMWAEGFEVLVFS